MGSTPDNTAPARNRKGLDEVATSVGATDLFVFRRVTDERFVHVGGLGLGESWAGNVDLMPAEDHRAREAIESGRVVHVAADEPVRVVGPYYERRAVFVPVSSDLLVVFGGNGFGKRKKDQETLRTAAGNAAAAVAQISPAKRLADELELLHAMQSLARTSAVHIDEMMRHVASSAVAALSCDLGVFYLADLDLVEIAEREESGADPAAFLSAMRQLFGRAASLPACVQDSAGDPLPAPLDRGVTSHYVLTVGEPALGVLALMHTKERPRGFTILCREIGLRLADGAEPLLRSALKLHELEQELALVGRDARIDPLTKLPNRRAWEEVLEGLSAGPAGVVMLDVDQLKTVNDERGHHVGDEYLQAVAAAMASAVRQDDFIARVGGDEFGILLPGGDETACRKVARRLNRALLDHETFAGYPLSASVGYAATPPAPSLEDAWRIADQAMYRGKPGASSGRRSAA